MPDVHAETPSDDELRDLIDEALPYSDSKGRHEDLWMLARTVLRTPRGTSAPFIEIGTRAGGSALLLLRLIERSFPGTLLFTVDPYGRKPYDGKPWIYGDEQYLQMKALLAGFASHAHFLMTSDVFIQVLDTLRYWHEGAERTFDHVGFVYLDGRMSRIR